MVFPVEKEMLVDDMTVFFFCHARIYFPLLFVHKIIDRHN